MPPADLRRAWPSRTRRRRVETESGRSVTPNPGPHRKLPHRGAPGALGPGRRVSRTIATPTTTPTATTPPGGQLQTEPPWPAEAAKHAGPVDGPGGWAMAVGGLIAEAVTFAAETPTASSGLGFPRKTRVGQAALCPVETALSSDARVDARGTLALAVAATAMSPAATADPRVPHRRRDSGRFVRGPEGLQAEVHRRSSGRDQPHALSAPSSAADRNGAGRLPTATPPAPAPESAAAPRSRDSALGGGGPGLRHDDLGQAGPGAP